MINAQTILTIETRGKGLYEITGEIARWLAREGGRTGLLNVFCRHTSASLMIQENADPSVQADMVGFLDRMAPENQPWQRHTMEGPDDMPAHIKSAVTDVSMTIPVGGGRMLLGTWQGVYLAEHRARPHRRQVVVHFLGD